MMPCTCRKQPEDLRNLTLLCHRAVQQAKNGLSADEIGTWLEETRFDSSIYITVATLKYLKQGGRITPAAAAIGTMLRLKPVLQIQGEKLDAFSKARTMTQAKNTMTKAIKDDIADRFGERSTWMSSTPTTWKRPKNSEKKSSPPSQTSVKSTSSLSP